jgi:hypothetical protein
MRDGFIEKVNRINESIEKVDHVSENIASVEVANENKENVTTVANDIANVNTTANDIANVNTTANDIANVNTTANDIASVNTVGESISNVNTVGESISNVNTTATNISDVNTVANAIDNVNITATDISKVSTVANDIINVNRVANNNINVNTVANGMSHVQTVSNNNANVTTVAENISDINTVANMENLANVTRVAEDLNSMDINGIDDITNVSSNMDKVETVNNSISHVDSVSTNIDNVNALVLNIEKIRGMGNLMDDYVIIKESDILSKFGSFDNVWHVTIWITENSMTGAQVVSTKSLAGIVSAMNVSSNSTGVSNKPFFEIHTINNEDCIVYKAPTDILYTRISGTETFFKYDSDVELYQSERINQVYDNIDPINTVANDITSVNATALSIDSVNIVSENVSVEIVERKLNDMLDEVGGFENIATFSVYYNHTNTGGLSGRTHTSTNGFPTIESILDRISYLARLDAHRDNTVRIITRNNEKYIQFTKKDILKKIVFHGNVDSSIDDSIHNISLNPMEETAVEIASISSVSESVANVNTVANNLNNINTTANNIDNVNSVGSNISKVNTTANNMSHVNTVSNVIDSVRFKVSEDDILSTIVSWGDITEIKFSRTTDSVNGRLGSYTSIENFRDMLRASGVFSHFSVIEENGTKFLLAPKDSFVYIKFISSNGTVTFNYADHLESQDYITPLSLNISNVNKVADATANINSIVGDISTVNMVGNNLNLDFEGAYDEYDIKYEVEQETTLYIKKDGVIIHSSLSMDGIATSREDFMNKTNAVLNSLGLTELELYNGKLAFRKNNDYDRLDWKRADYSTFNLSIQFQFFVDGGYINTVGADIANVNTVGADIANVNTVATDIANVNSVATDIANVNSVATDIANINTVATELGNNTILRTTDTINNLSTTDTTKPLSANQGKELKDMIDLKIDSDDAFDLFLGQTIQMFEVSSTELSIVGLHTSNNAYVELEFSILSTNGISGSSITVEFYRGATKKGDAVYSRKEIKTFVVDGITYTLSTYNKYPTSANEYETYGSKVSFDKIRFVYGYTFENKGAVAIQLKSISGADIQWY